MDKVTSLQSIALYRAEIVTYSKLGTSVLHTETIYISAPRNTRSDDIELAARHFCHQQGLTVSSIRINMVSDQPTFSIAEIDRAEFEKKR